MKNILLLLISLSISCQHSINSKTESPPVKKNKFEKPAAQNLLLNIPYRTLDTSKVISRIGFGSCNDQNKPQPLWKNILAKNPDLFVMMGDNVYASRTEDKPIYDQYVKLNSNKDYTDLREKVPFLATWDDHDYGQNDGGIDNPEKKEAQRVFLNYWSYTKSIIKPNQDGIYHSRIIGEKKQRVQIILLDTRSGRTGLTKSSEEEQKMQPPRLYIQDNSKVAQILSSEQWNWLQLELQKPAELRFIITSIQFIANDHGFEKWGNFPAEREKMIQLLEKNKIKNVIFMSGDRHLSSLAKLKMKHTDLFELTASGLNKPSRALEPEKDQLYIGSSFLNINYGFAEIDWSKKQVQISIIDENDQNPISQIIKF